MKINTLVTGINEYQNIQNLDSAVNDAELMSNKLKDVSNEILCLTNLNKNEQLLAIHDFLEKSETYDLNIYYFAGHGVQLNGENYIICKDCIAKSESTIASSSININEVFQLDKPRDNPIVIILDACRDNPFASLARSFASVSNGFSPILNGVNTLIAFSTSPNKTAIDSIDGVNSPYTKALASQISNPNYSLIEIFQNTRKILLEATDGYQVSWEHTSLTKMIYLKENKLADVNRFNEIINEMRRIDSTEFICSKYVCPVYDESTEGAELKGFALNGSYIKMSINHCGETWQSTTDYYMSNNGIISINVCHIKYNRPIYWTKELADENIDTEIFDIYKSSVRNTLFVSSNGVFIDFESQKSVELDNMKWYEEKSKKYLSLLKQCLTNVEPNSA